MSEFLPGKKQQPEPLEKNIVNFLSDQLYYLTVEKEDDYLTVSKWDDQFVIYN